MSVEEIASGGGMTWACQVKEAASKATILSTELPKKLNIPSSMSVPSQGMLFRLGRHPKVEKSCTLNFCHKSTVSRTPRCTTLAYALIQSSIIYFCTLKKSKLLKHPTIMQMFCNKERHAKEWNLRIPTPSSSPHQVRRPSGSTSESRGGIRRKWGKRWLR